MTTRAGDGSGPATSAGHPAVVLGLSPTGLAAVRSLGRRGVTVYGAGTNEQAVGRHSRYCRYRPELSRAASAGDADSLVDGLLDLARTCARPPILYATNDAFIEMLAPRAGRLEEAFLLSTDLGRFGRRFLDKRTFYELCRDHGVELAPTFIPQSVEDLEAVADDLEYPVIIKPAFVHHFRSTLGARKVLAAANAEELLDAYGRLATVDRDLVVQGVIPGADDRLWCALCYVGSTDAAHSTLVVRKLRQYPPHFGSACLAEVAAKPEVARLSERFLHDIGFRGVCATEFKQDPRDGRFKMIEVNARLPLWASVAAPGGVDVVATSYCDLTGIELPRREPTVGVRWTFAAKDCLSALYYARRRELSVPSWLRSLRGVRAEAVLSLDDPGPAVRLPTYFMSRALGRLARGASGAQADPVGDSTLVIDDSGESEDPPEV